MIKSGIESLASSADSIDTSDESINYAKMIETFRRYDKKCCGYLTKSQYKKFLHDMKIYQTEEFEEITFRAFVFETKPQISDGDEIPKLKSKFKSSNMKNSNDANEDGLSFLQCSSPLGITFEMARVICEAFGSKSVKSTPQASKSRVSCRSSNASVQSQKLDISASLGSNQASKSRESRRSSHVSVQSQKLDISASLDSNQASKSRESSRSSNVSVQSQKLDLSASLEDNQQRESENSQNRNNKKENFNNNISLKESETGSERSNGLYNNSNTASDSQLQSSLNTTSNGDELLKFERFSSAPTPKTALTNEFIPLSKKLMKPKTEKNGFKTKICSLILFRGVDTDRDGKIDFNEFTSIAKIVDPYLTEQDIINLFESCSPDQDRHLVTYPNVSKQLFDVFVWTNEDPYQQNLVNCAPTSRICILI